MGREFHEVCTWSIFYFDCLAREFPRFDSRAIMVEVVFFRIHSYCFRPCTWYFHFILHPLEVFCVIHQLNVIKLTRIYIKSPSDFCLLFKDRRIVIYSTYKLASACYLCVGLHLRVDSVNLVSCDAYNLGFAHSAYKGASLSVRMILNARPMKSSWKTYLISNASRPGFIYIEEFSTIRWCSQFWQCF